MPDDTPPSFLSIRSRFVCHRCGNCCRGHGYVAMTAPDVARAAALLGTSEGEFAEVYMRRDPEIGWHLRDQGDVERSCIFLRNGNECMIQAAKPRQCENFPLRWHPQDVMDYCAGARAAAGLPPPMRRTVSDDH